MLNQKQNKELEQVLNFTPYADLTEREKCIYNVAARNGYNLGLSHKRQLDRIQSKEFGKEIVKVKYVHKNFSKSTSPEALEIGNKIVDKVCTLYNVSKEDFVSIKRLTPIVQARSIAINIIK